MKNGRYELAVAPDDYPGIKYRGKYCYEHILNYWKSTGIIPSNGYEIHHLNGNHRDNRIVNLKLMTGHEHRILHGLERTKKATISVSCEWCKKEFTLIKRDYNQRIKIRRRLFCSRSCGAKNQFNKNSILP